MSYLIAVGGKGGVGKTTIAALLVLRLIARGRKPVLAIDADPNSCLNAALGVVVEKTLGSVREEAKIISGKGEVSGVAKQQLLEMKIAESLVEADEFDLIAMGRSEGPGCYCYANNVLKAAIAAISSQYPYVVLDNEAGLENLSRRIVQKVELMILVADPSRQGLDTVKRISRLAHDMEIRYDRLALAVNRVRGERMPEHALHIKDEVAADYILGIPDDPVIGELAERGKSLESIPGTNSVVKTLDGFLDTVGV